MASFTTLTNTTKPMDTSGWIPARTIPLTKAQKDAMEMFSNMEADSEGASDEKRMAAKAGETQSNGTWTTVTNKKGAKTDSPGVIKSTMKKVKVSLTIRTPKDTSDFSPAKLHIDTLHEIHKFDETLLVFNSSGDTRINIESTMSEARYKETFKPVEKRQGNNNISNISISHDIYLTGKANECKEAIFPFLKRNKIFIYFNPKPGLEHFTAIGVLFGPNPDYTWRDELADLLIETMKSEITQGELEKIGTTTDNKPKILISLNPQTIGISKPAETTSVALEIRVPTGFERLYTSIIERLYEKAESEELIIPTKLGKFFPYYMKSKMADVFTFMMRQQNSDMQNTAIIPIFGYTPSARKQRINIDGENTTVELAIATTPDIIRIEATPSTWNLHKYLVVVKNQHKAAVQKTVQGIFNKITEPLENQPPNFPHPRCGGSEKLQEPTAPAEHSTKMTAYLTKLETIAAAQNPQDAGPSEPPKRHRKITISYAGAVKSGILKPTAFPKNKKIGSNTVTQELDANNDDQYDNSSTQRQVSWDENTNNTSRLTGSSLSRSATNSKIQNFKKDIDNEIQTLKSTLENRMDQQDKRISEMIDLIHTLNKDIEDRMASAVIMALVREKNKVQELTHGRTYSVAEAPLADENGRLPGGAIAQSGGPLHRLHHVEVTVQHMASVLDTIAEHLQKDPSARHLFLDDDDKSETPTILDDQPLNTNNADIIDLAQEEHDTDVPMQMIREYGGVKRLLGTDRSPSRNRQSSNPNNQASPQATPPPKRERATISETSAKPEGNAQERGET